MRGRARGELLVLEGVAGELRGNVDELGKELVLKSNIKDVCALLDTKAGIADVNKALTEVHKELDMKAGSTELRSSLNDQALINEALCA